MDALREAGARVGLNPTEAGQLMVEVVQDLSTPLSAAARLAAYRRRGRRPADAAGVGRPAGPAGRHRRAGVRLVAAPAAGPAGYDGAAGRPSRAGAVGRPERRRTGGELRAARRWRCAGRPGRSGVPITT